MQVCSNHAVCCEHAVAFLALVQPNRHVLCLIMTTLVHIGLLPPPVQCLHAEAESHIVAISACRRVLGRTAMV